MKILINSIRNILSRERTIISNIYLNILNANILTRLISSRFHLTGTSTVKLLSSLSLRPHGLQHTRLLCPPLSPVVYSNSWPLSWPYYLTIPFSAAPFSFLSSILPSIQVFFKKVMTNLDSLLKSRDITLPTKVCLVKVMVFQWSRMDVRVGL